jgi:hypothetical protein
MFKPGDICIHEHTGEGVEYLKVLDGVCEFLKEDNTLSYIQCLNAGKYHTEGYWTYRKFLRLR